MKKIFFWSPHVSNVATVKNVINSAASLKKYNKNQINVSIIDAAGEWKKYKDEIKVLKINMIEMPGLNLSKFFPIEGFIKSRLVYFLLFWDPLVVIFCHFLDSSFSSFFRTFLHFFEKSKK